MEDQFRSLLQELALPEEESSVVDGDENDDDDEDESEVIPLRKISGDGNVQTCPTSTSRIRCVWCDRLVLAAGATPSCSAAATGLSSSSPGDNTTSAPLLTCHKCESAVYCSADCQRYDLLDRDEGGRHHRRCVEICQLKKSVQILSTQFTEEYNGVMDMFDRNNEMVFVFGDECQGLGSVGQRYLNERMGLVAALVKEAVGRIGMDIATERQQSHHRPTPHWNRLALELVMEHCLDMLHLDPVTNEGSVMTLVTHCLLVLERYQDLYDYVKYWNSIPRKLREIHRAQQQQHLTLDLPGGKTLAVALGSQTFLNTTPQAMFEDQSKLAFRLPPEDRRSNLLYSSNRSELYGDNDGIIRNFPSPYESEVLNNLYLALAKLRVVQDMRTVRLVTDSCLPIESGVVTNNIASFLGISAEWMATDPATIVQQCHELLTFANVSIPGILQRLVQRPIAFPLDFSHAENSDNTIPMLDILKIAWQSNSLSWSFLVDHVQNDRGTKIPTNDLFVQDLDRAYNAYVEYGSFESDYRAARQDWENGSETTRRFLMEATENGSKLYDHHFCVTRVWETFDRERGEIRQSVVGSRFMEYADLWGFSADRFLAREHLEQVRNRPVVLAFVEEHGIYCPRECVDDCRLMDVLHGLKEKGLATESNLKMLFGDDGRVNYYIFGAYRTSRMVRRA